MNFSKLLLLALIVLLTACNTKKKDDDSVVSDPPEKDMLSADWDYGSHILNLSLGNLSGSSFTMVLTDPGLDTCTCTAAIVGNQSAGNIQSSSCVASNLNDCTAWTYNGSTTYTNKDGVLRICRNGGACNNPHIFQ